LGWVGLGWIGLGWVGVGCLGVGCFSASCEAVPRQISPQRLSRVHTAAVTARLKPCPFKTARFSASCKSRALTRSHPDERRVGNL
jgi:hypothetical protein